MKRVNIYINKEEEDNLNYLSQVFNNKPRAEIVREAIDEYIKNKIPEIEDFYKGLSAEINDDLNVENEKFLNDCRKDPFLLIEKCMKINTSEGLVSPVLYDWEKVLYTELEYRNQIIINKARQIGMTTAICMYIVKMMVLESNKQVVIVTSKAAIGIEIINNIKDIIELLPDFVINKNNIKINRQSIQVNSNKVVSIALSSDLDYLFKGTRKIDLVYFDETAWMLKHLFDENIKILSNGNLSINKLEPLIHENTKFVIASTGRGYNHFCNLWYGALCNYNNLYPIQVLSSEIRGKSWNEKVLQDIGKERYEQEFSCKFSDTTKFKYVA